LTLSTASILGLIYVLSELGLAYRKRSREKGARAADQGSLSLLWIVIVLSVVAAFNMPRLLPGAALDGAVWGLSGAVLFAAGLVLRWYSIIHLGRFFTVDVAIASDHRLIDTGPYRLVRHPSYTGALMAFVGLALCMANWASLIVLIVPVFGVFLRRMQVEEAALLEGLGGPYQDYMQRTKRLIPGVY
jgi:protein-S-isoprenylcysteine O-methyltransferase Ste14